MGALGDIWHSITGNMRTRVKEPILGAFICSWVVWNWREIALLFLDDNKVNLRVDSFAMHISVFNWPYSVAIWGMPVLMTLIYLFVFPEISLHVKKIQKKTSLEHYNEEIDVSYHQATESERLNKALLKGDPKEKFLSELVQLDLDTKREELERSKAETARLEEKAEKERLDNKLLKENTDTAAMKRRQIEMIQKTEEMRFESQKLKFERDSLIHQSTMATHRFPLAFSLINKLDISLREDEIKLPVSALADVISLVFGYNNFNILLKDEKFKNEIVKSVEYIFYDSNKLAEKLFNIVISLGANEAEEVSSDAIFDHLLELFANEPYSLITGEDLEEIAATWVENNGMSLFDTVEVAGVMVEGYTLFEHAQFDGIEKIKSSEDQLELLVNVYATGSCRDETIKIAGQAMVIEVKLVSKVILGRSGLGAFKMESTSSRILDEHDKEQGE